MPMVLTGIPRIRKHVPLTNAARAFVAPNIVQYRAMHKRSVTAIYTLASQDAVQRDIAESTERALTTIAERDAARNLARHIRALSYSEGTYPR